MRKYLASLALVVLVSSASAQTGSGISGSAIPRGDHPLRTTEDESATLNGLMGQNGLVVIFWSNVCPWTERYTDRIVDLARDYQPAGIAFAAVNSNDSTRFPDEDFASMRRTSASAGFPFPYLVDDSGAVSIAFGARNTPHGRKPAFRPLVRHLQHGLSGLIRKTPNEPIAFNGEVCAEHRKPLEGL